MPETADPAKQFRVAVLCGLLGSVGAGLGLILWLASHALDGEVGVTIVVGAAVGVSVHWLEEYIHAAKHSKMVADEESESGKPKRFRFMAVLWGAGFGFLGLACEHLVAHLLAAYLDPFLATMANLAPAGVLISITMYRGRGKDEGALGVLMNGALLGLAIGLCTAAILRLGWVSDDFWISTDFRDLVCWWVMVGIGIRIATPAQPAAVRFYHPTLGLVAALCFTVVAANYFSLIPLPQTKLVGLMARNVLNSSGLPQQFWKHADDALQPKAAKSHAPPKQPLAKPTAVGPVHVAQNAGAGTPSQKPLDPFSIGKVNLGHGHVERPTSFSEEDLKREFQAAQKDGLNGTANTSTPANGPKQETLEEAADEMAKLDRKTEAVTSAKIRAELDAGLVQPAYVVPEKLERSLLVLLLFALGIGGGLCAVEMLKPEPYEGSVTAKKDVTLAVAMVVGLAIACVYGHLDPIKPPTASQETVNSER